ncbi:MAG: phosphopantothenate synthase, partial [Phycisphaerae bacterium]|nr:phosphopantothenate synthase [Phycisphaerae bacterium]
MPIDPSLDGKEIVVGITGGIACYKVAEVVSNLVQSGSNVQVLMTSAATKFISPLTFSSLSGNAVYDTQ